MGRVRPEAVKKLARELVETYPDKFTADYETNKKLVEQFATVSSKRLRNRIAGYAARIKRIEQKKEASAAATV